MFSWKNTKNISTFQMKTAIYLELCIFIFIFFYKLDTHRTVGIKENLLNLAQILCLNSGTTLSSCAISITGDWGGWGGGRGVWLHLCRVVLFSSIPDKLSKQMNTFACLMSTNNTLFMAKQDLSPGRIARLNSRLSIK